MIGHLGPQPKHVEPRPSVLDPYRSFVLDTLQRYPGLVSTRIYDMLGERGYTGSLRTLRRFVLLHRPDVPREVYVRIETLAGEQSQIDWAHVGHLRVPGVLSVTLFHRLSTTLCHESTAVDSLIAGTTPRVGTGDGKRSAGAIDDAITPARA